MRLAGTDAWGSAMKVSRASGPRDAAIPERPRVAVISHLASLAAKNAVEGRPDPVHATLDRVACHAILIELFATRRVAAGVCHAGRTHQHGRYPRDCSHRQAAHAGTSGPGSLR